MRDFQEGGTPAPQQTSLVLSVAPLHPQNELKTFAMCKFPPTHHHPPHTQGD